jgi:hypothetical protein
MIAKLWACPLVLLVCQAFINMCVAQSTSASFFNLLPGIDQILPTDQIVDMLSAHTPIAREDLSRQISEQLRHAQDWDTVHQDCASSTMRLGIESLQRLLYHRPDDDVAFALLAHSYEGIGDMQTALRCNQTHRRLTSSHPRHWLTPSKHPAYATMSSELRCFMHRQADSLRVHGSDEGKKFLLCQPVRSPRHNHCMDQCFAKTGKISYVLCLVCLVCLGGLFSIIRDVASMTFSCTVQK